MAWIFSLTEWKISDGRIVEECEGRGEDPRPRAFLVGLYSLLVQLRPLNLMPLSHLSERFPFYFKYPVC